MNPQYAFPLEVTSQGFAFNWMMIFICFDNTVGFIVIFDSLVSVMGSSVLSLLTYFSFSIMLYSKLSLSLGFSLTICFASFNGPTVQCNSS